MQQLLDKIRNSPGWEKNSPVLVAVSGGADSVALIHLARELRPFDCPGLWIIHLDHGLRPGESKQDSVWVGQLAQKLGLPFFCESCAPGELASKPGLSLEAAARQARLDFFSHAAAHTGIKQVVLAHHADDQAETVLFRLLRGSGPAGLVGMRSVTEINGITLLRPLLGIKRFELRDYLSKKNISFRKDQTNDDCSISRNRIRHQLLPELEKNWSPHLADNLCRLAGLEQDTQDYLRQIALAQFPIRTLDHQIRLDLEQLNRLPPALRSVIFREAMIRAGLNQPSARHFLLLEDLRLHPSGTEVHLPGGLRARIRYQDLILGPDPGSFSCQEKILSPGLEVNFPCFSLRVSTPSSPPGLLPQTHPNLGDFFSSPPGRVFRGWLSLSVLSGPLRLRARLPGDQYRPMGSGRKKVKEIMVDERLPREFRGLPLVLEDDNGVVGLLGGRLDNRFKLISSPGPVWELTVTRLPDSIDF